MKNIDFTKKIIEQVATDLTEEFDDNFDREGFFEQNSWKKSKSPKTLNRRGNSGLRGSINKQISNNQIRWTSSKPYASIHNEGGKMNVTQNVNAFTRKVKGKNQNVRAFSRKMNFTMPKRQFIGDHPMVRKSIETIVDAEFKKLNDLILNQLKR